MKSSYLFLLLCLLIILLSVTPAANSDDPLHSFCRLDATYAANSTFQANLDKVLSSLPSAAAPSGFNNITVGAAGPDQVHGLALCHGDVSPADCLTCLQNATKDIVTECPHDFGSTIWYSKCMLRYDNLSFFSALDMSSFNGCIPNPNNVPDPQLFDNLLGQLMDNLSTTAAHSPQMFAFSEVNFNESNKIYGMAQCTRDLASTDCYRCIRDYVGNIPSCCGGKEGGRLYGSNCAIEYEFYNASAVTTLAIQYVTAPLPPPPPPPYVTTPPPPPPYVTTPLPPPPPPAKQYVTTPPPPPSSSGNSKHTTKVVLIIIVSVGAGVGIVLFVLGVYLLKRKLARNAQNKKIRSISFDLKTLCTATNNFSIQNKLGSGGAGMVYKGTLPDGQEIAVKRFSGALHQGITELGFIVLMAMLEHPNLTKLIGFCYEKMEMLLVCEYLPNKSLDNYLFDLSRRAQLDWRKRYMIIRGVCQGLLYLHEDPMLTIIHRDLKASNILLDKDMNPKIADFGLAKLLGPDRTHEITRKNGGTPGYMAPEYYNKGQFSKQSDVYSYGILVLEIVTGERNSEFEGSSDALYLSTYVWKHWRNGKGLDVVDKSLSSLYKQDEALKCIQIGLLCAQHDHTKRPSMNQVSSMLDSPNEISEQPCEPGYSPMLDNSIVISSSEQEQALFSTYREVQERETV